MTMGEVKINSEVRKHQVPVDVVTSFSTEWRGSILSIIEVVDGQSHGGLNCPFLSYLLWTWGMFALRDAEQGAATW